MKKQQPFNLNSKKIIFIVPEIEIGGVETNTLNFCNNIATKFLKISIAYQNIKNKKLKMRFGNNINFIKTKASKARSLFFQYKKIFTEENPDYVVTSSFIILINLIIAKKISNESPKIIYKIETNLNKFFEASEQKIDRVLYKFFSTTVFSETDLLICSSNSIAESLKKNFGGKINKKIICIYNPVITEIDRGIRKKVSHKFFYDKNQDVVNLISVGRLIPSKGFKELILIIEKLRENNYETEFRLLIIGEGPEKISLMSLIKERNLDDIVDIINFNESFLDYIFYSDIYLSNSSYEGLNNNIIHSLRQGTKIISSDCNFGPREILENGKYGSLVPVGSQAAMIKKIVEISKIPYSQNKIEECIKRAEDFSAEKNSDLFCEAIHSI